MLRNGDPEATSAWHIPRSAIDVVHIRTGIVHLEIFVQAVSISVDEKSPMRSSTMEPRALARIVGFTTTVRLPTENPVFRPSGLDL